MMTTAPIVLFVFNRPVHTQRVLNSLQQNFLADESLLYIIADGPKANASTQDKQRIAEVRKVIRSSAWCKEIVIREKERNEGLAASVIATVTELLEKHGRLIVLEDDLVLSKYALQYFNFSLNYFENNQQINCIHGYSFPAGYKSDYFFLRGADCWGWATWKDRWQDFNADGKALIEELESRNLQHEFEFSGTYNFFKMLKDQVKEKNSSWAIRWYASSFLKNKLTLYPKVPFTVNGGNDGSGEHAKTSTNVYDNVLADSFDPDKIMKTEVKEDPRERKRTAIFFSKKFMDKKERIIFKLKNIF